MRILFEEQLNQLNHKLIEMGRLIETSIVQSIEALKKQDIELAKKTIAFDNVINQKEKDIEALCLRLLLTQQPVAGDLRLISAALKMITDMERIGDQTADIAEITISLANMSYIEKPSYIDVMAKAVIKMVNESIDAFVKKDLKIANSVVDYDYVVNHYFDESKEELVELFKKDSSQGSQILDLLMITKYLERIGDHAKNIAEWVIFSITGKHKL